MNKYRFSFTGKDGMYSVIFEAAFPDFATCVGFVSGLFHSSDLDCVIVYDCDSDNSVCYERKTASVE